MKKVTLKTLHPREVLFLKAEESVIVLSGNLHMITYQKDLQIPYVARTFTAGDLIGLPEIDDGWCRAEHAWIVAWESCDLFFLSAEYLRYMWD